MPYKQVLEFWTIHRGALQMGPKTLDNSQNLVVPYKIGPKTFWIIHQFSSALQMGPQMFVNSKKFFPNGSQVWQIEVPKVTLTLGIHPLISNP